MPEVVHLVPLAPLLRSVALARFPDTRWWAAADRDTFFEPLDSQSSQAMIANTTTIGRAPSDLADTASGDVSLTSDVRFG